MLYALLCYNSEAQIGALSKAQNDEMMDRTIAATRRIAGRNRVGPTLRLMPTTAAVTVRAGDEPLVIDGPYAETKEQLLGFWIVDCATLEEAIEAGRILAREREVGALEVRPVLSYSPTIDGGDAVS